MRIYGKPPLPDDVAEGRVGVLCSALVLHLYTVLSLGGFACWSILETTLTHGCLNPNSDIGSAVWGGWEVWGRPWKKVRLKLPRTFPLGKAPALRNRDLGLGIRMSMVHGPSVGGGCPHCLWLCSGTGLSPADMAQGAWLGQNCELGGFQECPKRAVPTALLWTWHLQMWCFDGTHLVGWLVHSPPASPTSLQTSRGFKWRGCCLDLSWPRGHSAGVNFSIFYIWFKALDVSDLKPYKHLV